MKDDIVRSFRREARDLIDAMAEAVIGLGHGPGGLDALFRSAHTLKGASLSIGAKDTTEIASQIENSDDNISAGAEGELCDQLEAAVELVIATVTGNR